MKKHDPPAAVGGARQHQWLPGRDTAKQYAAAGTPWSRTRGPHQETTSQARLDPGPHPRPASAYQLNETLRAIFTLPHPEAALALDRWLGWPNAAGSRIPGFVALGRCCWWEPHVDSSLGSGNSKFY
jgi:hypothetical protein